MHNEAVIPKLLSKTESARDKENLKRKQFTLN